MAVDPHVGTPHHLALQTHGLTSAEASSILGLPNLNPGTVIQFVKTHGPAAIALLKILLPFVLKDPALLALLQAILNGNIPPVLGTGAGTPVGAP